MSATSPQIERLLEAQIVAALAAVITDRPVIGFWQPAEDGGVKASDRTCVEVRVQPRSAEGYESDILTFPVVIAIQAAVEDDPAGSRLPAAYEAALTVTDAWDSDDDAAALALSVDAIFRCDAVMPAGGDCGFDDAVGAWFITIQFMVRGCVTRG